MFTSVLTYTLLGDGSSDEVLLRHIAWLLEQHLSSDITTRPQWADLSRVSSKPSSLAERIEATTSLYPCDLLFVHRDAEGDTPEKRRDEIEGAVQQGNAANPFVCVIPVRMQEAWLLFDERAIRHAAGNPNGKTQLNSPTLGTIESLADPKQILLQSLRRASELTGRKLKRFRRDESHAARRVADYIEDFSPLRSLPAFERLESDVEAILAAHGWSN